jgi:hypothetical protein
MTILWSTGHTIDVTPAAQGTPAEFVWQGRTYAVAQIVQRWQIDSEWWRGEGRIWRDYFVLITQDNLFCVIYFDRIREDWRLVRLYD